MGGLYKTGRVQNPLPNIDTVNKLNRCLNLQRIFFLINKFGKVSKYVFGVLDVRY